MQIITDNIQWIMIVAGVLTLTMLQAFVAPQATIRSFFGETVENPAALLVVRNWGFIIASSALFVLYAAFHPEFRVPALLVSGAGKLCFAALVFGRGARYAKRQAFVAAIIDTIFVLLFALYLFAAGT